MKLWTGRFSKEIAKETNDFNSSISFDQRMYKEDITGSMAHAKMLGRQGIIPTDDAGKICRALSDILDDIEQGKVEFSIDAEDIHMNIEKLLTERIGDAGKRLHTGRSRNDQVALDIRMYMMREMGEISGMVKYLAESLISTAEEHKLTYMPGYTHLQKAQPITFAHYLMAYVNMFLRDLERIRACIGRTDSMPLGSGALATTTYPL
ncbi:MAG: argininosuccinate lyase, partial [Clostridia bacterium]|nr:argininosuccinate lyase [Clostridia bacterium]